jgi:hypothetical protein
MVSPWVLGFSLSTTDAARAAWILGAAIVVLAAIAVYMPRAWEEGLNILLKTASRGLSSRTSTKPRRRSDGWTSWIADRSVAALSSGSRWRGMAGDYLQIYEQVARTSAPRLRIA